MIKCTETESFPSESCLFFKLLRYFNWTVSAVLKNNSALAVKRGILISRSWRKGSTSLHLLASCPLTTHAQVICLNMKWQPSGTSELNRDIDLGLKLYHRRTLFCSLNLFLTAGVSFHHENHLHHLTAVTVWYIGMIDFEWSFMFIQQKYFSMLN